MSLSFYHVQRFLRNSNDNLLSIELLENDRPLFLCYNKQEWYCEGDPEYDFIIHKLDLKLRNIKSVTLPTDEYFRLFSYSPDNDKYVFTSNIDRYVANNYNLFIKENKFCSESEMFLIDSKNYVRAINIVSI